jgi:uncharacterized protein YifN (PemK superfamily)
MEINHNKKTPNKETQTAIKEARASINVVDFDLEKFEKLQKSKNNRKFINPKKRQIIMCDFGSICVEQDNKDCESAYQKTKCLRPPEMVKKRPVLVITARLPGCKNLITILPFSTTKPKYIQKWHYQLDKKYLPKSKWFHKKDCWVLTDRIYTVSTERTWFIKYKGKAFFDKLPIAEYNEIEKRMILFLTGSINKKGWGS